MLAAHLKTPVAIVDVAPAALAVNTSCLTRPMPGSSGAASQGSSAR